MSTLKVESIQHPSSSTPAISLDSNGAMTGSFPSPNRNLIYNGAMQVAQRGTSTSSITGNGYYTADRWATSLSALGTWTQSVESDAPAGSGFRNSVKMLCTTADAAPSASDFLFFQQRLEGQDVQRIAKGTSDAQQLTLSFWVKSNVIGTYIARLVDSDNSRHICASYSISASATWERKTITFDADTTGELNNDNGVSLSLHLCLGAGSDRTSGTLDTTWASTTTANIAPGQTNLASATNNYWQITGVQLETGPVATEFEFKSYGQELAECQRYYWRAFGSTTKSPGFNGTSQAATRADIDIRYPVEMRSAPTVSVTGTAKIDNYYSATANVSSVNAQYLGKAGGLLINNLASNLTQGHSVKYTLGGADYYVNFSSEL